MGARVVGQSRRPVRTAPPPAGDGALPWREAPLHGGTPHAGPAGGVPPLFIVEGIARAIDAHVRDRADAGEEALGLLIGDWALDGEGAAYTVALDAPTGELAGTRVSVRFRPEGLAQVATELDTLDYDHLVVGWYHSHLDLGCFMSDVDLRTQRAGFPHAHQVAVVIDAVRGEVAAFANLPGRPGTARTRLVPTRGTWARPSPRGDGAGA
jgi:proteasome lid subunit RPN8/RPN11